MELNLFEAVLYGLVSGVSQFLPVSTSGHRVLLLQLFGKSGSSPLLEMLLHISLLVSVFFGLRGYLEKIRREKRLAARYRSARRQGRELRGLMDLRLVRTAALPMCAGLLLYLATGKYASNLLLSAGFLILNGAFFMLTEHLPKSNKDAGQMSGFDAVLIGLSGVPSVLPGFSRVGLCLSTAILRGADTGRAYVWAILLSIPALITQILLDLISIIVTGIGVFSLWIAVSYAVAMVFAFIGGFVAIRFMRGLADHAGLAGFAYYCWGVALLSFILFIIV